MPIFLPAPAHNPGGPDGQGWNRLSIGMGFGVENECALLPRSYATLIESQDTRRARWGGFGRCHEAAACGTCPVLQRTREGKTLAAFGDRVLARIDRDGQPYLMNHPERGWESFGYRWTWPDLARLSGWTFGPLEADEHGDRFWLHRATGN